MNHLRLFAVAHSHGFGEDINIFLCESLPDVVDLAINSNVTYEPGNPDEYIVIRELPDIFLKFLDLDGMAQYIAEIGNNRSLVRIIQLATPKQRLEYINGLRAYQIENLERYDLRD